MEYVHGARWSVWALALLSGWLSVCLPAPWAAAEEPSASAAHVKAAFLYNFAKFIEWPPVDSADARPFVIGVFGDEAIRTALEQTVQGKTVTRRPVAIRRVEHLEVLPECHLVLVGASERSRLAPILQALEGRSVLTVTELEGGARQGAIINFVTRDQKIRFEINAKAAERAGLKISSQLLKLAVLVVS